MKKINGGSRLTKKCTIILLGSFLITSCASIDRALMDVSNAVSSRDPVTGKREINIVPEEEEVRSANNMAHKMVSSYVQHGKKVNEQTPIYERALKIFNNLREVTHRKSLPWKLYVVEDDNFNAFTIGGGKVFLYTGLFKGAGRVRSDDELAAVIAHEMAHVTARHVSETVGKTLLANAVSKTSRTSIYKASFTTIQESEADKYSTIYMALAGYEPRSAAVIWSRLHNLRGSFSNNLLYDHPLYDERATKLKKYASLSVQYFSPGEINPAHEKILIDNDVFKKRNISVPKAGEGGGTLSFLETLGNAYIESQEARLEKKRRENNKLSKEIEARSYLQFSRLKIANAKGGGKALFGYATNRSNRAIRYAYVKIRYIYKNKVVYEDKIKWVSMKPYERSNFGIPLKSIRFSNASIIPEYIQLSD